MPNSKTRGKSENWKQKRSKRVERNEKKAMPMSLRKRKSWNAEELSQPRNMQNPQMKIVRLWLKVDTGFK